MRFLDNINVDFLSKRKIAYLVSGTLILISLISLVTRGLELGIDFVGGTEIAVHQNQHIGACRFCRHQTEDQDCPDQLFHRGLPPSERCFAPEINSKR